VIFLGHGDDPTPRLSVDRSFFSPGDLFTILNLAAGRRILVILDCCFAAGFANAFWTLPQGSSLSGRLWFLAAGAGVTTTTAFVLGQHGSIPDVLSQDGHLLKFGLYGTDFHRRLLATVFDSDFDGRLPSLPAHLNGLAGPRRGFDATLIPAGSAGGNEPRFRSFFPGRVNPSAPVGHGWVFQEILPLRRAHGQDDDICADELPDERDFWLPGDPAENVIDINLLSGRFVDFTGAMTHGRLQGDVHLALLHEFFGVTDHRYPGRHADVRAMVTSAATRRGVGARQPGQTERYVRALRQISNHVREWNGLRPGDVTELMELTPLLDDIVRGECHGAPGAAESATLVSTCCRLLDVARFSVLGAAPGP
jgi:hypothetical protein